MSRPELDCCPQAALDYIKELEAMTKCYEQEVIAKTLQDKAMVELEEERDYFKKRASVHTAPVYKDTERRRNWKPSWRQQRER